MRYRSDRQVAINKPVAPDRGISTDYRSWYYEDTNPSDIIRRPYNGTAEVLDEEVGLPISVRGGNFSIYINIGGILQPDNKTFIGGETKEFWFPDPNDLTSIVEKKTDVNVNPNVEQGSTDAVSSNGVYESLGGLSNVKTYVDQAVSGGISVNYNNDVAY